MRILHVAHSLRRGGAERVVVDLSNALQSAGHQVAVATLSSPNDFESEFMGHVFELFSPEQLSWPMSIVGLATKLRRVARDFRPDVVFTHNRTSMLVVSWARLQAPVCSVIHGYGDVTRSGCWKADVSRWIDRVAARCASPIFVAVAPGVRNAAMRHFGSAARTTEVIFNGIATSRFVHQLKTPQSPATICTVGTLAAVKRPLDVVRAFAALLIRRPDCRLMMVGDGPLRQQVAREVAMRKLNESVDLLGKRTDVAELLKKADIFWQLSESEGLPLSVMEAMCAGVPVVGTSVRGISCVTDEGRIAVLVPLGETDKVAEETNRLLEDPPRYRELAQSAWQFALENYDGSRMYENYSRLLLRLTGNVS